ncbi:hypothetical protein PR048_012226 [Dryococelus australis]|uniref:PiggyBac transposable element-derived protein domain-containing protein n=1 Tax=Dryococelus australis TaxID=614101 RepID=A0ABQ9HNR6_9NEOP|nr:hypothetical protein PR048_012226 [Dryococelus australis]
MDWSEEEEEEEHSFDNLRLILQWLAVPAVRRKGCDWFLLLEIDLGIREGAGETAWRRNHSIATDVLLHALEKIFALALCGSVSACRGSDWRGGDGAVATGGCVPDCSCVCLPWLRGSVVWREGANGSGLVCSGDVSHPGGTLHSNRQSLEELWGSDGDGVDKFCLVMNFKCFEFLLSCIRFDDKTISEERRQSDRLAAVRKVFLLNCEKEQETTSTRIRFCKRKMRNIQYFWIQRRKRNYCVLRSKEIQIVIMISSLHFDVAIYKETGDRKKPEIITFYNQTKSGVDVVDKLCTTYNVARNCHRWPMAVYFAILNIGGINAQVVFLGNGNELKSRRNFLKNLSRELVEEHFNRRSVITRGIPSSLQQTLQKYTPPSEHEENPRSQGNKHKRAQLAHIKVKRQNSQIFLCEPGLIPGPFTPEFRKGGIVLDDIKGRTVFLWDLSFPQFCHSGAAPCSPHFTLIGSQELVKSWRGWSGDGASDMWGGASDMWDGGKSSSDTCKYASYSIVVGKVLTQGNRWGKERTCNDFSAGSALQRMQLGSQGGGGREKVHHNSFLREVAGSKCISWGTWRDGGKCSQKGHSPPLQCIPSPSARHPSELSSVLEFKESTSMLLLPPPLTIHQSSVMFWTLSCQHRLSPNTTCAFIAPRTTPHTCNKSGLLIVERRSDMLLDSAAILLACVAGSRGISGCFSSVFIGIGCSREPKFPSQVHLTFEYIPCEGPDHALATRIRKINPYRRYTKQARLLPACVPVFIQPPAQHCVPAAPAGRNATPVDPIQRWISAVSPIEFGIGKGLLTSPDVMPEDLSGDGLQAILRPTNPYALPRIRTKNLLHPSPQNTQFSLVGIVLDDPVGSRVFSGISLFPRSFIPAGAAPHSPHFTIIGSSDLDVKSRSGFFTYSSILRNPHERASKMASLASGKLERRLSTTRQPANRPVVLQLKKMQTVDFIMFMVCPHNKVSVLCSHIVTDTLALRYCRRLAHRLKISSHRPSAPVMRSLARDGREVTYLDPPLPQLDPLAASPPFSSLVAGRMTDRLRIWRHIPFLPPCWRSRQAMAYDPINIAAFQRVAVFGECHLAQCGGEVMYGEKRTTTGDCEMTADELRVQGQEARERYGLQLHAHLAPHRSYAHGVQCFRRNAVLCKLDLFRELNDLLVTVVCTVKPQMFVHWLLPQSWQYGTRYLFPCKCTIGLESSKA